MNKLNCKCNHCGRELPKDAIFCAYCGKKILKDLSEYKSLKVGDNCNMGTYGGETIQWRVLTVEDGKALLLSEKGLDAIYYDAGYETTWETCSMRRWLNKTFFENAFSKDEKEKILKTKITADKNPKYDTNPGNDTEDKVFLLSIAEVKKYFHSNESRMCIPTSYAINNGAYESDMYNIFGRGTCWWWLRSPGVYGNYAAFVLTDGSVYYSGDYVGYDNFCVRPALWINLES